MKPAESGSEPTGNPHVGGSVDATVETESAPTDEVAELLEELLHEPSPAEAKPVDPPAAPAPPTPPSEPDAPAAEGGPTDASAPMTVADKPDGGITIAATSAAEASKTTTATSAGDGSADAATTPGGRDNSNEDPAESPDATTAMEKVAATTTTISTPTRKRKKGRLRRFAGTVALLLLGALVLLVAAWGLDTSRHAARALRNVYVGDVNVGGFDRDEIAEVVDEQTAELGERSITVSVGDTSIESDPVSLGLRLNTEQMTSEALAAKRNEPLYVRPFTWAADLFGQHRIPNRYEVDPERVVTAADEILIPELDQPVEPVMELKGSVLEVSPGADGITVDPREAIGRLPVSIEAGEPYEMTLAPLDAQPSIDTDELQAVADEVNEQTSAPIAIQVLDQQAEISPRLQRSWIVLTGNAGDGEDEDGEEDGEDAVELGWEVDGDQALEDLKPLFPSLGEEDQQAKFKVVNGTPTISPASETVICCEEGSGEDITRTIRQPIPAAAESEDGEEAADEDDVTLRIATLEPIITGKDEGVAELESLGIVEEVSTFTTEHQCCQNRVKNIQRFADLMQGVIIRPGEEFSLNDHVGQRTIDKGFVADGAIARGKFEQQVGGGISQYATTFFNASFFAGVEFLEYQSHSIYISRYPRGREATISWRRPDLRIRNNTEYGILVWNEYTPTSITVSFYSTKHLNVEALALRRSSDRQCRIDITPRVITHDDGTQVEDTVRAIYRPGEGLDCNGNSTTPDEE